MNDYRLPLVFCVAELLLCVLIVCADVSRNYVISQVAGLKPLKTNRHVCSAFRVYMYACE